MKHAFLYAVSLFLTKGIALLLLPWMARHLSVADFGQLELIALWITIGSVLVAFSMTEALYRYATPERGDVVRFLFEKVQVITLGSMAGVVLIYVLMVQVALPQAYLWALAGVTMALEGLISFPMAWLRMRDRSVHFVAISMAKVALQTGLVVLAISIGSGVLGVLIAGLLATVFHAVLVGVWMHRDLPIVGAPVVRWAKYCWPLTGAGLLAIGLFGIERAFIAWSGNLEDLGVYAIAAKFGLALALLMQPYGMWWFPKRSGLAAQSRTRLVPGTLLGLGLLSLISGAVLLITPMFIRWVFPEAYWPSIAYLLPVILTVAAKEWGELANFGIWHAKPGALFKINLIAAVLGAFLMWLAGWLLDALAVVYALAAVALLRAWAIQWLANQSISLVPNWISPLLLAPWLYLMSAFGQWSQWWQLGLAAAILLAATLWLATKAVPAFDLSVRRPA